MESAIHTDSKMLEKFQQFPEEHQHWTNPGVNKWLINTVKDWLVLVLQYSV